MIRTLGKSLWIFSSLSAGVCTFSRVPPDSWAHKKKALLMSDSELSRQGFRLCILTFAGECCALRMVFDWGHCSSELSSEHTHGKHGREGNRLKTAYPFGLVFCSVYSLTLDLHLVFGPLNIVTEPMISCQYWLCPYKLQSASLAGWVFGVACVGFTLVFWFTPVCSTLWCLVCFTSHYIIIIIVIIEVHSVLSVWKYPPNVRATT